MVWQSEARQHRWFEDVFVLWRGQVRKPDKPKGAKVVVNLLLKNEQVSQNESRAEVKLPTRIC